MPHRVDYIDVLKADLPLMRQALHWYREGTEPQHLVDLETRLAKADGYVFISPEYNHCLSPSLANFLNHFPQETFEYKPSLIVTYSAGQFGGTRAAMQLRDLVGVCFLCFLKI